MKPIMSVMFLLFLVLLAANRTAGIRSLEEESVASLRNQVHEEKSLMKEGSGVRGALLRGCHGDCSGSVKDRRSIRKVSEVHQSLPGSVFLMKSVDRLHGSEIGSPLSVDAGKSRKLMTDAMATSKNDIGSQDDLHKAPPVSRQPQTYPDVVDIAGMDYSPANRKPPIHN
ncbi:hypothetical protein MUK42_06687 [Musa troglodytarum]|uniref:Uncharacterized protein n=1 Tax=Musa troglodytarum TaxID=320322 RepID=A0A9E7L5U5_9LILI|nr:hypothetical protein MUK42_06687 [Musa troglodytarum]